ncbi:MAG: hypothetical protein ACI92I_000239 [Acidimicrobiales bacterium]|jgi:hypothetical protein
MSIVCRHILGILLVLFMMTTSVFAASDDITIGVYVYNTDLAPPSIPTSVVATAIATSQIDITWNASTDDVLVVGYRLFRDTVQIATTSLTSYSDTGLTQSTSYTYHVQAYDAALNISTSSATSSATTLTPAPEVSSSSGGSLLTRLIDFSIIIDQTQVQIDWETNTYTRYSLHWGKGDTYDLGSVQNDVFKKTHRTFITGLETGTQYAYELIAYDNNGRGYVLSKDTFTTEVLSDVTAPLNVDNLRFEASDQSVTLSWVNPPEADFDKVRIVRSSSFYPSDQVDGYIMYEGKGESFLDTDALASDSAQYYSIFSYDEMGNISSGAVIKVQKTVPTDGGTEDIGGGSETTQSTTTPEVSTTTEEIIPDPIMIDFDFNDLYFIQNEQEILWTAGLLTVASHLPVTVYIPYEVLPEHLKTIVVTLTDKEGKESSYILRVDRKKTKYEATFAPLKETGMYSVHVSVYDFSTDLLTDVVGTIFSEQTFGLEQVTDNTIISNMNVVSRTISLAFLMFLLLTLLTIYFIYIRKQTAAQ